MTRRTFRDFLLEQDDGEDIVFGLRKLLSDIRVGWSSSFSDVKKTKDRLWKKLSEAQQANLRARFEAELKHLFSDANQKVRLDSFKPIDKAEATFIVATLLALSMGAREIDTQLIEDAVAEKVLTPAEAKVLRADYTPVGGRDVTIGPVISAFLKAHQTVLERVLLVMESTLGFDVARATANLRLALSKTPEDKRVETVRAIHFFLLDLAHELYSAHVELGDRFKRAKLKGTDTEPAKPSEPTKPTATKPATPTLPQA